MSKLVSFCVELLVGEGCALTGDGDGLGGFFGLRFDEFMQPQFFNLGPIGKALRRF